MGIRHDEAVFLPGPAEAANLRDMERVPFCIRFPDISHIHSFEQCLFMEQKIQLLSGVKLHATIGELRVESFALLKSFNILSHYKNKVKNVSDIKLFLKKNSIKFPIMSIILCNTAMD